MLAKLRDLYSKFSNDGTEEKPKPDEEAEKRRIEFEAEFQEYKGCCG